MSEHVTIYLTVADIQRIASLHAATEQVKRLRAASPQLAAIRLQVDDSRNWVASATDRFVVVQLSGVAHQFDMGESLVASFMLDSQDWRDAAAAFKDAVDRKGFDYAEVAVQVEEGAVTFWFGSVTRTYEIVQRQLPPIERLFIPGRVHLQPFGLNPALLARIMKVTPDRKDDPLQFDMLSTMNRSHVNPILITRGSRMRALLYPAAA